MSKIQLTKQELESLDLLIKNYEETGSIDSIIPEASIAAAAKEIGKALVREGAMEAVRQVVEKVVEKVTGNSIIDLNIDTDFDRLTKPFIEKLEKKTSLEDLKAIRNNIELK